MQKTLEQIEVERLTRRAALGRIGFLAGAAAVAALTSDELFRKVGVEMERRAGDNKIVGQVAKELQAAGVANAVGTPEPCSDNGFDICPPTCLELCVGRYNYDSHNCRDIYNICLLQADTSRCFIERDVCNGLLL